MHRSFFVILPLLAALIGCGPRGGPQVAGSPAQSDPEQVRAADYSILFVGNSHTAGHDLPTVVGDMIHFQHPDKTVYTHRLGVMFLDDAASNPRVAEELETRPWKAVVLQAQRISVSGKFDYSKEEGIALAKQARGRGAAVHFYSEWGLQGVEGDGKRNEGIYRSMAEASGAGVVPVGRAWDLALAERPDLPLYAPDGNHQTQLGAFLTACVLAGRISGDSPAPLADFPYPNASAADRKFLAEMAAKALAAE